MLCTLRGRFGDGMQQYVLAWGLRLVGVSHLAERQIPKPGTSVGGAQERQSGAGYDGVELHLACEPTWRADMARRHEALWLRLLRFCY